MVGKYALPLGSFSSNMSREIEFTISIYIEKGGFVGDEAAEHRIREARVYLVILCHGSGGLAVPDATEDLPQAVTCSFRSAGTMQSVNVKTIPGAEHGGISDS